jgi:hypothetical protein
MFEQKIVDLIKSVKISGKFHPTGSIPDKKEQNARASLQIPAQDKMHALVDITIFGSAKDSVAICSSGVYWKGLNEKPKFLKYSELLQSEIATTHKPLVNDNYPESK